MTDTRPYAARSPNLSPIWGFNRAIDSTVAPNKPAVSITRDKSRSSTERTATIPETVLSDMITTQQDTPPEDGPRPLAVRLYVLCAVSLGISAIYGGMILMLERANDPLGLPLEWLDETPFRDYFVPGLTLLSVFGVGSFVVVFGVLRRRAWAWIAAVGLGVAQIVWIAVEVFFLRMVQPLHVAYGGLGAVLVALATRPSVREYLTVREDEDVA